MTQEPMDGAAPKASDHEPYELELAMAAAWRELPPAYDAPELPTSLILRDLSYAVLEFFQERGL